MSQEFLAAVLIYGITLIAACLAIWLLKSKPARIAAVIVALATLVAALVPVIKIIVPDPGATTVVAPTAPAQPTTVRSVTPTDVTGKTNISPSTDTEVK
ncbi:hypothetical protein [Streptomyces mirabilis]|uniref:hypothetical protein n=1 Tax=Streptomyces mirabilis TaxID=68239 RepID=UPI00331A0B67